MIGRLALRGGQLLAPSGELVPHGLLIEAGRIVSTLPPGTPLPEDVESIDLPDCIIAPGFIDTHVHGGHGHHFMDGTAQSVAGISGQMVRGGTTSCLATTTSAALPDLQRALDNARRFAAAPVPGQVQVLGTHLEGPFVNPKFRGVHLERFVRLPQAGELAALLEAAGGTMRVVTLAPEVEGGMEAVRFFAAAGVSVSIGHSGATYQEARAALAAGVRRGTHVFNALPPIHHRDPGPVLALMEDASAVLELIVDGHHVHPAVVAMTVRQCGPDRIVAVTDCTDVAGQGDGLFTRWEGVEVMVKGGQARTQSGALAGSVLSLNLAVANLVNLAGIPLPTALRMASEVPACAIHVADRKGSLAPGKDADVVVLAEDLSVRLTMVRGEIAYDGRVPHETGNGTRR